MLSKWLVYLMGSSVSAFSIASAPNALAFEEVPASNRPSTDELDATYRVVIEDGKLFIKARNAPRASLVPLNKDEFRQFGSTFKFTRNDQGRLSGLVLNGGRSKGIQFVKKAD